MTPQQLLSQLKTQTQAGRYAYLQKAAYTKALKQLPPTTK
jgi:hypothetical protein